MSGCSVRYNHGSGEYTAKNKRKCRKAGITGRINFITKSDDCLNLIHGNEKTHRLKYLKIQN